MCVLLSRQQLPISGMHFPVKRILNENLHHAADGGNLDADNLPLFVGNALYCLHCVVQRIANDADQVQRIHEVQLFSMCCTHPVDVVHAAIQAFVAQHSIEHLVARINAVIVNLYHF